MEDKINIRKIGKLRVYLKAGEIVKSTNFFRKIFPKNVYSDLMDAAKKEGILNSHVIYTNSSYRRGESIHHNSIEGDNSSLTICVEMVDEREKLEDFFKKSSHLLAGKTVIYKEVEHWSID